MKKGLRVSAEFFTSLFGKRKFIGLFITLTLVLILPLFVNIVNTSQDIRQNASETARVVFTDANHGTITQTTTAFVHVALASPWSVSPSLSDAGNRKNVLGQQTATFSITDSYGDINEVKNAVDAAYAPSNKQLWLGTGEAKDSSYAGLRFSNITLPKNAVISSAKIQVLASQTTWLPLSFQIAGDAVGNSQPFARNSLPSSRVLTSNKVTHSSNVQWKANTWYSLDELKSILQELVNRPDWKSGNSISFIVKGTGSTYARKFIGSFDAGSSYAPKLVVSYDSSTVPTVAPTKVVTIPPTTVPPTVALPTSTPTVPLATPTPLPVIKSIVLSEDSNFSSNLVSISPVLTNPTYATYTFSNNTPGVKTLYAKFRSSTGEEQVFSNTIQLVAVPTPTPTTISTMPDMPGMGGNSENSVAMSKWVPMLKYDNCPTYPAGITTDQQKTDYIISIHQSYKVKGPDGKWYPTWHPPVDPATGCKFGHEHGRDPKGSEMWATKQIQQYFYYDANKNGVMDPSEEAVSGLPFGYVNEQYSVFNTAAGKPDLMRHEDHVGHKVEYANGEGDIATDKADNSLTGGVHVQRNKPIADTGVRCYYLAKPHQGVSTADAFTNNIHEVFYFADCRSSNSAYNQKISIAKLFTFGKPGGFTSFMPLCGIERRSNEQDFVNLGTDAMNSQYPASISSQGDREIVTRECVEKGILVPSGSWSGNFYEAWPASLDVKDTTGKALVSGINLLFDVEDANRYFYPEALKQKNGYTNPDAKTNVGFTMDLCYDQSLASQGRIVRGGPCEYATNYGQIKNITWNDPRSAFKGIHRGMYFQPGTLANAGGSEFLYSDPFGNNAKTTPFPGSIKQQISTKNLNYGQIFGLPTDPRVNDRVHNDGNGTVHAPN